MLVLHELLLDNGLELVGCKLLQGDKPELAGGELILCNELELVGCELVVSMGLSSQKASSYWSIDVSSHFITCELVLG